ncbi:MAG: zinc metalloprotease [Actinobacteria bacterium]|nr:zinc metalloprotease [Actinomycetota bacterium]
MAAGLLALLGATAAQAGAVQGQASRGAAATCVSEFSSLRTLTGHGRKIGPFDTRDAQPKRSGDAKALAKANGKKEEDFRRTIAVNVHVITNRTPNPSLPFDDTGRVTTERIEEQISVLNLAYGGFGSGVDSGFRFKLKKVDYTENAGWYVATVDTPAEAEMKRALRSGKPDDLNLYIKGGIEYPGSAAGWAYMPDIVGEAAAISVLGGVVVDHRTLPGGPIPGFDLGHTATHELGHWLGLFHTFHPGEAPGGPSGCDGEGDFVADTPAHDLFSDPGTVTGPCGEGSDSCSAAGVDPIYNFMNYSYDQCYSEFTAGQAARMQSQFLHWRDKAKYARA